MPTETLEVPVLEDELDTLTQEEEPTTEESPEEQYLTSSQLEALLKEREEKWRQHFNSVSDQNSAKYQREAQEANRKVAALERRLEEESVAGRSYGEQAEYWKERATKAEAASLGDLSDYVHRDVMTKTINEMARGFEAGLGMPFDQFVAEIGDDANDWGKFSTAIVRKLSAKAAPAASVEADDEEDNAPTPAKPKGLPSGYTAKPTKGGGSLTKYRSVRQWQADYASGKLTDEQALQLKAMDLPY